MALTFDQWLGIWLIVATAVDLTATVCLVTLGLWACGYGMDGRRGGCRGGGCRRSAGPDGVASRADGSARGDWVADAVRLGWMDIETMRRYDR